MSTENIAYEKRYRDWRAQYDAMFAPENRSSQQDEQFPLMDGYSIRSKAYTYDGDLHLCSSESELLDDVEREGFFPHRKGFDVPKRNQEFIECFREYLQKRKLNGI